MEKPVAAILCGYEGNDQRVISVVDDRQAAPDWKREGRGEPALLFEMDCISSFTTVRSAIDSAFPSSAQYWQQRCCWPQPVVGEMELSPRTESMSGPETGWFARPASGANGIREFDRSAKSDAARMTIRSERCVARVGRAGAGGQGHGRRGCRRSLLAGVLR